MPLILLVACGGGVAPPSTNVATGSTLGEGCANVVAATAELAADGTWTISATVSSADTGWDKYADAWEVRGIDGSVLGRRELAHPHEDEQPFTRSLAGVEAQEGRGIIISARDSVQGFCGQTLPMVLSRGSVGTDPKT